MTENEFQDQTNAIFMYLEDEKQNKINNLRKTIKFLFLFLCLLQKQNMT